MKPTALILRSAGTNCDVETAHAFELAGAQTKSLHINRLIENPALLADHELLALPGGFSYGDDIAAGRILANQIIHHLADAFRDFVDAGKPIIGICNGFQVLVKTDLLPGPLCGRSGQTATLTNNDCHRFIDRWVSLAPMSDKCIWTRHLGRMVPHGASGTTGASPLRPVIALPIAHGEGKFVPADEQVRQALWDNDQVALTYCRADGSAADGAFPDNPNGSVDDIAGVCDATGLVFGLMPHPERHVTAYQHPAWTRCHPLPPEGDGLQVFRNAVQYVAEALGAGV